MRSYGTHWYLNGAVALVRVNLTALDGDPRVAEAEQLAAAAERSATRVH